ncbi:hypothetical protein [Litoreibacter ponti]|uniref:hypothetical protein n=1 Tax=Litoreibacter ponti TaxID=1510457 RepID=UPI0011B2956E|nr:hypothetical protein [Litoreibacter ponti]
MLFFALATLGITALKAIPQNFVAESRLALETPLALASAPKATRTADHIQHLQTVVHGLRAEFGPEDDRLSLSIESAREKPTILVIRSKMKTERDSLAFVNDVSAKAIAASDTSQRTRIDSALEKLRQIEGLEGEKVKKATARLAEFRPEQTRTPEELSLQLDALRRELESAKQIKIIQSPEIQKLTQELANARALYSDQHPAIKLLNAQIEHGTAQPTAPILADLEDRVASATTALARAQDDERQRADLEAQVAIASAAHLRAQDALAEARLKGDASFRPFNVIEDATAQPEISAKKLLAARIAILGISALAAIGLIAMRFKLDRRVRRPRDLARGLGIAPFATLPDLGPSLA